MTLRRSWLSRLANSSFVTVTAAVLFGCTAAAAPPAVCTAPAYRQFDFWAGDWDVFDAANPKVVVARVRVDRILDGCVIREDYQASDGKKGQSFSIYDASRNLWHQSWVTNHGEWILLDGSLQGKAMVLTAVDRTADGKDKLIRGVWTPGAGAVHETAVISTDGGMSWKPWFNLWFRRHK